MIKNTRNVSETDTNAPAESVVENTQPAPAGETPAANKPLYEGVTRFVYIGAALPQGKLQSYKVLIGTYAEITEYYKETIAEYPGVEKLIVPAERLAESREKAQKSGNLLYKYCQEVAETIKAKGEKE